MSHPHCNERSAVQVLRAADGRGVPREQVPVSAAVETEQVEQSSTLPRGGVPKARNVMKLRHFIHSYIALLKDWFQEAVEFILVHLISGALKIAHDNIPNV